jgi:hypothetical protein
MVPVFAGCCEPLLHSGRSRRCPLQSIRRRLIPYPAVFSRCACSLLPGRRWPHVRFETFGTQNRPCNATSTGGDISRLQIFAYVQAPTLARPPDCTHRRRLASARQPGRLHHATSWLVTCPRPWYRFAPKTSNWRGGTFTRRIAALSAAPKSCHPDH